MINPVSKAGRIFLRLNRSSPHIVNTKNKMVINEKGIARKCNSAVYRIVETKMVNPALKEILP